jgi:hypothetical protein
MNIAIKKDEYELKKNIQERCYLIKNKSKEKSIISLLFEDFKLIEDKYFIILHEV